MALKFKTILTQLQMKIMSGEWSEGHRIPTEMELCSQYGVSRVTVRRALEELVNYGYITRTRGRGSFVLFSREPITVDFPRLYTAQERSMRGQYKILLKEKLYATEADRQMLRDEAGYADTLILHVKSLHILDDKPTVLSDYYIADRFAAPLYTLGEYTDLSIFEILSRHHGQQCFLVEGKVAAIIPNGEICAYLNLNPTSANLWFRGDCALDDGTIVGRCTKVFDGLIYEVALS